MKEDELPTLYAPANEGRPPPDSSSEALTMVTFILSELNNRREIDVFYLFAAKERKN